MFKSRFGSRPDDLDVLLTLASSKAHRIDIVVPNVAMQKSNEERKAKVIPHGFVQHVQSALSWEASDLHPYPGGGESEPLVLGKVDDLEEHVDEGDDVDQKNDVGTSDLPY